MQMALFIHERNNGSKRSSRPGVLDVTRIRFDANTPNLVAFLQSGAAISKLPWGKWSNGITTPTGLRPSAQGCEGQATLGKMNRITTPRGLWQLSSRYLLTAVSSLLILLLQCGCERHSPEASQQAKVSTPAAKMDLVPLTNMVSIKAGSFVRIKHLVTLTRDFWLGKYEVTQAEYEAVMGKNPSRFQDDPNRPVEKLTYLDALSYCAAITKRETQAGRLPSSYVYRLPTEAEWEYACRAGTTNLYSFGDTITNADQFAWTLENSEATTHPVGQKLPNPWGLCDMHGNVWEWCQDWFGAYDPSLQLDPKGPFHGETRVRRGGGFVYHARGCRSTFRWGNEPTYFFKDIGMRLAHS
jgi:formylglycine-generating enzyme required for sulfatase activity